MVLLHESRKKSSQGTQAVNHFRPRARRARGRKWLLLEARGMIFFCLSAAKPFMPKSHMHKLHLYISFSGIYISGKIRAENAFSDHPV